MEDQFVWVVLEYNKEAPDKKYLFGVYGDSEEQARKGYGEPDGHYNIQVVKCKVAKGDQ